MNIYFFSPPGRFNNLTGQAECFKCPFGYYCDATTDDEMAIDHKGFILY